MTSVKIPAEDSLILKTRIEESKGYPFAGITRETIRKALTEAGTDDNIQEYKTKQLVPPRTETYTDSLVKEYQHYDSYGMGGVPFHKVRGAINKAISTERAGITLYVETLKTKYMQSQEFTAEEKTRLFRWIHENA